MPLQNRVTPYGEVVALPGRGLMMGNRGILHDDERRIVRQWQVRRWIACVTAFRGRHRTIMQPHRYTELFFLDEAAALSAGHRPCKECRYGDYRRFCAVWERLFGGPVRAGAIDLQLHADRLVQREKRTYGSNVAELPDGTYVELDGRAWLLHGDALHAWSDSGYTERRARPSTGEVDVLTPRSLVEVLRTGYRPELHPTAAG